MKNDDLYYLGNRDNPPIRFTVESGDRTIIQELHWDADANELLEAFYTAMVGLTFSPSGVLQAMQEFVNNKTPIDEGGDYESDK